MLTGKYTYRIQKLEGTLLDKQGNSSRYNCPQWKFLLGHRLELAINAVKK